MNSDEAIELLEDAVEQRIGTWADFGAGEGTFTRALVSRLGAGSRIYAVDRDAGAVSALRRWAAASAPNVIPLHADFTREIELPGLGASPLDGMLFANALHYVRDPGAVLARLVRWLRPGGRVVFVEYDRRAANPWVPYPISIAELPTVAESAGLTAPIVTATRPSAFGGDLYVATAERSSGPLG